MAVIEMSVQDFIDIPDNPRQRDTERHARKAVKGHLSEASPTHSMVAVASIDGDIACKLDGHTRAYLWENGEMPYPAHGMVTVVVYQCSDLSEASELYTHFDNQSATEASCDRMFGACRENGMSLTSSLLRTMRFTVALRLAAGEAGKRNTGTTEYDLVKDWKREITALDGWDINSLQGPLVGLALLLIRKYGDTEKLRTFFKSFCSDAGVKTGTQRDGVQALSDHLVVRRTNKTLTGWDNIVDFAERGLTCFNAYRDGRMMGKGVRRTTIKPLYDTSDINTKETK